MDYTPTLRGAPSDMDAEPTINYGLNNNERQHLRSLRLENHKITRRGPGSSMDCTATNIPTSTALNNTQVEQSRQGRLRNRSISRRGPGSEMECEVTINQAPARGMSEEEKEQIRGRRLWKIPSKEGIDITSNGEMMSDKMDAQPCPEKLRSERVARLTKRKERSDMDMEEAGPSNRSNNNAVDIQQIRAKRARYFRRPHSIDIDSDLKKEHDYQQRQHILFDTRKLTDNEDPRFAIIIDMDALDGEWDQHHCHEKGEEQEAALRKRCLWYGMEFTAQKYIPAIESTSWTLRDFDNMPKVNDKKGEYLSDLLASIGNFGISDSTELEMLGTGVRSETSDVDKGMSGTEIGGETEEDEEMDG